MTHLSEIEKKVFEIYPVTEKERNCRVEKSKRDWLREKMKKELYEQAAYSKKVYDDKPEV